MREDPLGLEPDTLRLLEVFGTLTAERDEMCRPIDEKIVAHEVIMKKLREERKQLTGLIDAAIAEHEKQIKEAVMEARESAGVGRWTFVYSERVKVDSRLLREDSEVNTELKKYLGVTRMVSPRFK